MASVREHDVEAVRHQLTAWLSSVAGLTDPVVGDIALPATGVVNDTFVYDVTWGSGATARHVLRAAPRGFSNLRENDVLAQARFLHALRTASDLPVPEVLWVDEEGGPFERPVYVMAALPGEVAADMPPYVLEGWLHDASPSQRADVYRQAVDAVAAVHDVDWAGLGVPTVDLPGLVDEFLGFTRWGAEGESYPTLDAAADWLVSNLPRDPGPAVLTWNDGRLGNMLFDRCRLTGLLDWELVTVGPPELDLAWLLWHDRFSAECLASAVAGRRVSQLEGAPTLAEGARRYEEVTAHSPKQLGWYEAWAAFRMAVYLMRHGKGMVAAGLAPPDGRADHVNIASVELARMLRLDPPR